MKTLKRGEESHEGVRGRTVGLSKGAEKVLAVTHYHLSSLSGIVDCVDRRLSHGSIHLYLILDESLGNMLFLTGISVISTYALAHKTGTS